MNETVNQVNENTSNEAPKTFTQEEVNAIVGERLKRASEKYADYESLKEKALKFDELEESKKSELEKANERVASLESELNALKKADSIRGIREKVSSETGVPANLLTAETEEECKAQAEAIKSFANPSYPSSATVKDGGEVTKTGKPSTRDQFANWAEKQL